MMINSPTSPVVYVPIRRPGNPLPRANESKATQAYHHPSGASLEHFTWMQHYLCVPVLNSAHSCTLSREIAQSKKILPSSNSLRHNLHDSFSSRHVLFGGGCWCCTHIAFLNACSRFFNVVYSCHRASRCIPSTLNLWAMSRDSDSMKGKRLSPEA